MQRTFTGSSQREARARLAEALPGLAKEGWRPVEEQAAKEDLRFRPDRHHITVRFEGIELAPAPPARPPDPRPAYVKPSDRPYASTACPACGIALDPPPKKKVACPGCGVTLFVRSGPDGKRYLLDEPGVIRMQNQWEAQSRTRWETGAQELVANRPRTPRNVAFEVVGESNYQNALANLCGGREEESANFPCTATVIPEPENPYDPKAVRIDVEGATVGYLSRKAARTFEPIAQELRARHATLTCPARVVGGWQRGFDAGSFGIVLNLPTPEELHQLVASGGDQVVDEGGTG